MKTTMSGRMTWGNVWLSVLAMATLVGLTPVTSAQTEPETMQVIAGEAVVKTFQDVIAIAVADPNVADAVKMGETPVYSIIGKKPGVTTLTIVRTTGEATLFRVEVAPSAGVRSIHQAVASTGVTIQELGDAVVLEGKVKTQQESDRAAQIASVYKAKVVNLVEVTDPKKVKIRSRLVEVRTDAIKKLGVEYFGQDGSVTYGFLFGGIGSAISDIAHGFEEGPESDINQVGDVQATLNLMATKGLTRTLSEPTLVTLSGKEASFLSGGEVPIVQTLANSSTVEFKEFGVRLKIKPVVDSENNITSQLATEVSQVNFSDTVGNLPTFLTRRAETEVQVKDGQTIVIGGLLRNELGDAIRKVPWLGDIPVLGNLFRSKNYQQGLSELLVFVTLEVLKDVTADAANAPQMPDMKEWNGRQADEELRQPTKPDPEWQKPLDVDELTIPAARPAESEPPAAPAAGAASTEPVTNFSPAPPAQN